MNLNLKTKLVAALGFLFLVILAFGILSVFYINKVNLASDRIIKNNYETLVFSNNMLKALNELPANKKALDSFELNLQKQELNATEPGEQQVNDDLKKLFEELKLNPDNDTIYNSITQNLQRLNYINQSAIYNKNEVAKHTASETISWLSIIFSVLTLIAFTLVWNIPRVIASPVEKLSEGIKEIARKNYNKRIYLDQKDEFGDLANTFNIMAEKLDEYEHSNLAKIKFEKSRTETIINQMRDGIIGFDEKRNILFLNAIAEKLLNLKEKDITGKYAADVALNNDLMRTLLQKEEKQTELKIFIDNKESYFNKDILNVMDKENNVVIGQVIVLKNITPFYELSEAKTNFIATVSHELKTPISSIKISTELLADEHIGNLNAEQKKLLQTISDNSTHLLKITDELLNVSQVETGNIQLKLQSINPLEIVDKAINAVQTQALQKNIQLKKNIPAALPNVYADVEKTLWVLISFLTNAINHSGEKTEIEISVLQKNDTVSFVVKDSGEGIEVKYLPKIFDRHFKVPGSKESGGTGLGLAISKEFIEAEGGTVWVESNLGSGSAFGFDILTA